MYVHFNFYHLTKYLATKLLPRLSISFMRNRGYEKKSVSWVSGFAEDRKKVNKLYSFVEEDGLFC